MYQRQTSMRIGGPLTPIVKKIIIVNIVIFILQNIFPPDFANQWFALSHNGFINGLKVWQVFTYMFMHGGWLHLFLNMFALWIFAGELEQVWGSKFFLRYYLLSGLGAGIFIVLMNSYMSTQNPNYATIPTVGASGAVYGILLAYGMTWPNREVLLYFILPVKMKYLVLAFGLIEFFGTLNSAMGASGNISHIGHLGGLVTGLLLLLHKKRNKSHTRGSTSFTSKKKGVLGEILKKNRLKKKQEEIEKRIKAKKIIDKLLDKIASNGISSLSAKEKKDLEWARKNYYPGNNETYH